MQGQLVLPWWGYVAITLGMTHLTIVSVTIFLHRHQSHRAMELHPLMAHLFRFWLWLTTGQVTRVWVSIHRKHHAHVESVNDPHSPQIYGIRKVLWQGAELYRKEAKNADTLAHYGHGTPNDWLERNVYARFEYAGIALMLVLDVLLFGAAGIAMWAVQMAWIPFFAAGVINGVGHWAGYRNFETGDASTNIWPLGLIIGGEELHNNHHAYASSARFSAKPWEFDIGWLYIRLMSLLRLARVKKVAPRPAMDHRKTHADLDTLSAVISNRFHVMAEFARHVVHRVHREEVNQALGAKRELLKPVRDLLTRADAMLDARAREQLLDALCHSQALAEVYRLKMQLQEIWTETSATQERLLSQLQEWCRRAEQTGIRALEDFASRLQRYTLQPARV